MASNRKKVLLPDNMGKAGVDLLRARGDIEVQMFPGSIGQAELLPLLSDTAGIALGGTPYKQIELDASPAIQVVARIGVGYDAVEVPALSARGVPLMVAGTSNSTSVAEHAFHLMMALAKRVTAMDTVVHNGSWGGRFQTELPMELSGTTCS